MEKIINFFNEETITDALTNKYDIKKVSYKINVISKSKIDWLGMRPLEYRVSKLYQLKDDIIVRDSIKTLTYLKLLDLSVRTYKATNKKKLPWVWKSLFITSPNNYLHASNGRHIDIYVNDIERYFRNKRITLTRRSKLFI